LEQEQQGINTKRAKATNGSSKVLAEETKNSN
jgi:hypothetical protein